MASENLTDNSRVIPIVSESLKALPIPLNGGIREKDGYWIDMLGRPLTDIRISVTDHCNFRCRYCKPKEIWDKFDAYLPHEELLNFEELYRISRIAVEQVSGRSASRAVSRSSESILRI